MVDRPEQFRFRRKTDLVVTEERVVEFDRIRESVIIWAPGQEDVQGVAVGRSPL